MNPRKEAFDQLGGRYEVRVLEPSPPAVTETPWLADDPVARGDVPAGRTLVSPVATGDVTWDELCRDMGDQALAAWCADRWLGAWSRLPPAPADLEGVLPAWHALAEHVLAPARHAANGKIGLRWTRGGVGTPYFDADRQVRLAGRDLIVDGVAAPVSTLRAAAEAVGVRPGAPGDVYTATTPLDLDSPLTVDPDAAAALAGWYGFATAVLEEWRATASPAVDQPSRVQLWPEHFDLSVELGPEASGGRVTYGASPGDDAHSTPYLYVLPWTAQPAGPTWNDCSFAGASLAYSALAGTEDQRAAALAFFQGCLDALAPVIG